MLAVRKWTDEDIDADIQYIIEELQKNVHDLSYVAPYFLYFS